MDAPVGRHQLTIHFQFTALWTINAVVAQITYYTGGNVDVLPAQAPTLSDYDVWVLSYGSIWEFASWYTYSGNLCTPSCAPIYCRLIP